jgi:ubiquitin-conjugating enzyme E2 O
LNNPPAPFQKEVHYFFFNQKKLEQTVVEGLQLIAATEGPDGYSQQLTADSSDSGADATINEILTKNNGLVIKRISRGALKMLKKHINTLKLSIEE